MNTETVYQEINQLFVEFQKDHAKSLRGNKAAARRARNTSLLLRDKLKEYRSASIESEKDDSGTEEQHVQ